jgi:hypothetical protein
MALSNKGRRKIINKGMESGRSLQNPAHDTYARAQARAGTGMPACTKLRIESPMIPASGSGFQIRHINILVVEDDRAAITTKDYT